jgi:hypothetical protein
METPKPLKRTDRSVPTIKMCWLFGRPVLLYRDDHGRWMQMERYPSKNDSSSSTRIECYLQPIRVCQVGVQPALFYQDEDGNWQKSKKRGIYNKYGQWYKEPTFFTKLELRPLSPSTESKYQRYFLKPVTQL